MFSRGFATGRTSAHNVQICTARVLTGSTLMPAQIAGVCAAAGTYVNQFLSRNVTAEGLLLSCRRPWSPGESGLRGCSVA
jgi:hypothetical protein